MRNESRFRMVEKESPERFRALVGRAREVIDAREALYRHLAGLSVAPHDPHPAAIPEQTAKS
jgi:hypothetical protein